MNLYDHIKYDQIGLYSLTKYTDALNIYNILFDKFGYDIHIIDGTGGLGGNSFLFNFKKLDIIEIDKNRYELLKYNINTIFNIKCNVFNDDVINFIDTDFDLLFLDPPWGGLKYYEEGYLSLSLSNMKLIDIIYKVRNKKKNICLKLPFNYNYDEFAHMNYEKYKINNYYIVLFCE